MSELQFKTTDGATIGVSIDINANNVIEISKSVYSDFLEQSGVDSEQPHKEFEAVYSFFHNFTYNYNNITERDERMLSFYTYIATGWVSRHNDDVINSEEYKFPEIIIDYGLKKGFIAKREVKRITSSMSGYFHSIYLDCHLDDHVAEKEDAFFVDCEKQDIDAQTAIADIISIIETVFEDDDPEVAASNTNLGDDILRLARSVGAYDYEKQHVNFDLIVEWKESNNTSHTSSKTIH